jgi:exodeoxyribonuclease VII small subunit
MAKALTLKDLLESDKLPDLQSLAFENGIKILEELVEGVETGNFSLDKSIIAYERGSALMAHLKSQLEGAEQKLKMIQLPSKG